MKLAQVFQYWTSGYPNSGLKHRIVPFLYEKGSSHKWQIQNLHKLVLQDRGTSDNFKMTKADEKGFFPYIEFKLISSTTNHSKAQASQFLSVMSSI